MLIRVKRQGDLREVFRYYVEEQFHTRSRNVLFASHLPTYDSKFTVK
jgi:hypothetical protein